MTNSTKILQKYNIGDKVLVPDYNNELRRCTIDLVQFDQEKNEIKYIVVFEKIRSSTQKPYQGRLEINDSVITDLVSRSVVGDDFIWDYIKEIDAINAHSQIVKVVQYMINIIQNLYLKVLSIFPKLVIELKYH